MSVAPLIPPPLLARLKSLRLGARIASGAHALGQHRSRNRGAGLEFAQYRAYEPGDDLRRIDWKLYARSDRFFVRESERDSPLTAWIVVDATASMAQSDPPHAPRKLDAAVVLAACVIELAVRQGDQFGVVALTGDGIRVVDAGAGPRHRDRCVQTLRDLQPSGALPADATRPALWQRVPAGALVLLVSDLFDESLVALAERLARARREVVAIQVLSAQERDFPFHGSHRFVEPESGDERQLDADASRALYLQRFGDAQRVLAARCAAAGIRHVVHVLDAPLDTPLVRLFGGRPGDTGA